MDQMSISQKIKWITMALIGTIAVAAVISFGAMLQMRATSNTVKLAGDEMQVANLILEDVLETRLAVFEYGLSASSSKAEEVHAKVQQAIGELNRMEESKQSRGTSLAGIEEIRTALGAYAEIFDRKTALQEQYDQESASFTKAGTLARITLNGLERSTSESRDTAALLSASSATKGLLMGRIFGERYLRSNNPEHLDRARKELAGAQETLSTLASQPMGQGRRVRITEAIRQLDNYAGHLETLAGIVVARNDINAELDATASATQNELDALLGRVIEDQDDIRDLAMTTALWSLVVIGGLAALSIGLGSVVSARIRRSIDVQIDESLETMTALAEGDLEVEVRNTEADTEVGRIARALVLFRDKGLEARQLEEETKAKEEEIRKREEAEAARRQVEEREAAERIETERRKTMAELSGSIGEVVRAAVNGDFSCRISHEFADPELREMAEMINKMAEDVERGVNETASVVAAMATGDLSRNMNGEYRGTFAELSESVNATSRNLADLIDRISEQCRDVALSAGAMSDQSHDLQSRVEQQAASLEETAAAMEEISATVRSSAENSSQASQHATATAKKAAEAGKVVENAVAAMQEIREASSKIEDIVSVIDGISFQTSLLALNAGVEAARAGESGRGFAVVASEVRALALRSSEASKDIQTLITLSSERIEKGVELVEATGQTLVEVVDEVEEMSTRMVTLKSATTEQATGIEEVTGAISQLDGITQENARLADQGNRTSNEVTNQADAMQKLLSSFKTRREVSTATRLADTGT